MIAYTVGYILGTIPSILPCIVIRYFVVKQGLSTGAAFIIAAVVWLTYFLLLTSAGASASITGPGASVIAVASYYILISGYRKQKALNPNEINFSCPHCQESINTGVEFGGSIGTCPNCNQSVTVPEMPQIEDSMNSGADLPIQKWKSVSGPIRNFFIAAAAILSFVCLVIFAIAILSNLQKKSPKPIFANPPEVSNETPISKELEQVVVAQSKIDRLIADAANGNAIAQYELYLAYMYGEGVSKDIVTAKKWLRASVDSGHASAQNELGALYVNGEFFAKDMIEAVKWFRKAADQGHSSAQANIGFCYISGDGVLRDDAEALKWFRKAADQGDANGQHGVGLSYTNGIAVNKNMVEAVTWFRRAAEQGLSSGQFSLGFCYALGEGIARNDVEAVNWFRKAAEQGNVDAFFHLGESYAQGEGVAKDAVEAYKWFNLAAAQGVDHAAEGRATIEKQMTPEQIAEAQKLSREWTTKQEQKQ